MDMLAILLGYHTEQRVPHWHYSPLNHRKQMDVGRDAFVSSFMTEEKDLPQVLSLLTEISTKPFVNRFSLHTNHNPNQSKHRASAR